MPTPPLGRCLLLRSLCQDLLESFRDGDTEKLLISLRALDREKPSVDSFDEEEIYYVTAFQHVSKCLKIERSYAHPERSIGKKRQHVQTIQRIDCSTHIVRFFFDIAASTQKLLCCRSPHHIYFFVCCLFDVTKYLCEQSVSSFHEFRMSLRHVLSSLQRCYESLQPSNDLAAKEQNEDLDQQKCIREYYPLHCKVVQLLAYFAAHHGTADSTILGDLTAFSDVLRSLTYSDPHLETAASSFEQSTCSRFIDARGQRDQFVALYIQFVLCLCDEALKEFSHTHFDCRKALQLMEDVFRLHREEALVVRLRNDDKDMVGCLLKLATIALRCSAPCTLPATDGPKDSASEAPSITKQVSIFSSHLCTEKLDILSAFVHFLKDGIFFDELVLIDLLCGTETPALQYILRVSKTLQAECAKLPSICAALGTKNIEPPAEIGKHGSLLQTKSDNTACSSTKVIILDDVDDNDDNYTVASFEWNRLAQCSPDNQDTDRSTESHATHTATPLSDARVSENSNCTLGLYEKVREFLQRFVGLLHRYDSKSMLPFKPGLLMKRLEIP
jgi:hypothetical protein